VNLYLHITDINPVPWQSPDISVGRGKGGRAFPVAHSPANMRAFQSAIKECVTQAYPNLPMFPKGASLHVFFYYWRGLDLYKTASGRRQTAHRADTSNISKNVEDALQGIVYHNDVDNETVLGRMVEQSVDTAPALLIAITDRDDMHGLLSDMAFINDLVVVMEETIPAPLPPGNVRMRIANRD
jgi:Holliday junction resolvase RusA-like endonuclease